jgi:prolyl 4-hydroxylase
MVRPVVEHPVLDLYALGPVGSHHQLDVEGETYNVSVLSTEATGPRVLLLKDFLSLHECATIIADAKPRVIPAKTGSAHSGGLNLGIRSSSTTWLNRPPKNSTRHWTPVEEVVDRVSRRIFNLTGIDYDSMVDRVAEEMQVVHYGPEQKYNSHCDWFNPRRPKYLYDGKMAEGSNRFATILFYLSSPEAGGETFFPRFRAPYLGLPPLGGARAGGPDSDADGENLDCRGLVPGSGLGLKVPAKAGSAILFYSMFANGTLDDNSVHGGCAVEAGEKWAANVWLWDTVHIQRAAERAQAAENAQVAKAPMSIVDRAAQVLDAARWGYASAAPDSQAEL